MASFISFLIVIFIAVNAAYGMDCTLGTSENVVEKFINTCPRPIVDSKEEEYCCWTASGKEVHCCNLQDFIFNSISLALPLIIICLVVSFIVSCLCCVCCPFCCCYKRRSGGRVLRQGPPLIIATGPYSVPPTTPYQPLSGGAVFA